MTTSSLEPTKPNPPPWPRISASLFYDDAAAAIDWLCRAFGFTCRLRVEGDGGVIEHSELSYGDGVVMVAQAGGREDRPGVPPGKSPRAVGGANTAALFMYVDDAQAHCARARAAGARISVEPKVSDYGDDYWSDLSYGAIDLEGHHWWFAERLRDPVQRAG